MMKFIQIIKDRWAALSQSALPALVTCGLEKTDPCTWNDLYILINDVISFMIFDFGIPLATIAIVVSGIELVIHSDSATAKSVWKDRLFKAIYGLVIMMTAFLIVKVVVFGLTPNRDNYNLQNEVRQ